MFWSQLEDNSINDLLVTEDVTLEDVLCHESLLQECRSQNDKLAQYLTESGVFCKLLQFVLVTPSEQYDESLRFKFSSLSCEVLASDIPTINQLLITGCQLEPSAGDSGISEYGKPFIEQFCALLSKNDSVNPLTMSFCIKILLNLLKFDNESLLKFFNRTTDCIDVFLKHIDSTAMIHFLTEFLQCEDEFVDPRKQWLRDNKLILKIVNLLGDTEYRNNSVQVVLTNIIYYMSIGMTNKSIVAELTDQLNEEEFQNSLFKHISNESSYNSLIFTCLKIIRSIIEMEIKRKEGKITYCVELIEKKFDYFLTLLTNPPKQMYGSMPTTVGIFQPFGPTRIEIVNLVECCLKLENEKIIDTILNSKILNLLLNYVDEYKWNSQFHLSLLRVIEIIFSDLSSTSNKYFSLQKYLVQDFQIFSWFIQLHENLETCKPRPGYSGILWKIGNLLESLKNSDIGNALLSEMSDLDEKWSDILTNYLTPLNNNHNKTSIKYDTPSKELDYDFNIIEIDEADIEASSNKQDELSNFFRTGTDNVDDIFDSNVKHEIFTNSNFLDNDDDWISNELKMPSAPTDDSSSSDEESPAVIRQKEHGNAAKIILSEVRQVAPTSEEPDHLPDMNDSLEMDFLNLDLNDPWEAKSSDSVSFESNWAKFDN